MFSPPPSINRTYHVHNITPYGAPFHQIGSSTKYQDQSDTHQTARNRNRNGNQQPAHNYNRIPTLLKDNIAWEKDMSGNEDELLSKEELSEHINIEDDEVAPPPTTLIPKELKSTLNANATPFFSISHKKAQAQRNMPKNDSDEPNFQVGDRVSLLTGPFTIMDKIGSDTYELYTKEDISMIVSSNRLQHVTEPSEQSSRTTTTMPNTHKNEMIPIDGTHETTRGPKPLSESGDLLNEIRSFLDFLDFLELSEPPTSCHQLTRLTLEDIATSNKSPAKAVNSVSSKVHPYPEKESMDETDLFLGSDDVLNKMINQRDTPTRSPRRLFYPLIIFLLMYISPGNLTLCFTTTPSTFLISSTPSTWQDMGLSWQALGPYWVRPFIP